MGPPVRRLHDPRSEGPFVVSYVHRTHTRTVAMGWRPRWGRGRVGSSSRPPGVEVEAGSRPPRSGPTADPPVTCTRRTQSAHVRLIGSMMCAGRTDGPACAWAARLRQGRAAARQLRAPRAHGWRPVQRARTHGRHSPACAAQARRAPAVVTSETAALRPPARSGSARALR